MSDNLIDGGISGESILTCAARVAQTIESGESFSEIMALIAVRCAESGLLDAAIELLESIDDPDMRERALADIATACVEFEEDDLAEELLAEIEDPGLHGAAMEQIATKYAQAGAFEKALEMADEMDDTGQALGRIAYVYEENGRFREAVDAVRSIEDFGLQTSSLVELAARNNRAGRDIESTCALLQEAKEIAEEIDFPEERINILLDVAALFQEVGAEEHAVETLSQALKLTDQFEGIQPTGMAKDFAKDKTLSKVAAGFARLQRYDQAGRIIEMIEDPFQFAIAQTEVALEHDKAGQREQALTLLADALEIARYEEVYGEYTNMLRERLFSALATSYVTVGHVEEALEAAKLISDPGVQFETLREMATTCARSGKHDCISKAVDLLENPYARVLCKISVSDAFADAAQTELSIRTLYQVLEKIEALEIPYEKALVLMEIAERLARRGHEAKASELLFNALETIALIKGGYQKAHALIILDEKHRKIGQSLDEREEETLEGIAP